MVVMADRVNQVEAVKSAIDIVDVIGQYTTLQPAGNRMKGLSPFTNEKTPSFFVDPDAGVYYCFSSQKGGDVFSFVQDVEGIDFKEALRLLAERAGIDLVNTAPGDRPNNAPLYHLLESAASVYQQHLNGEVRQYLIGRGITEQSIQEWGIGYAPDAWNAFCTKQSPNLAEQVTVGMCIENKEKQSVYDRFRNRVQFPFYDDRGRVIGFSGRMYGDDEGAKYINSPTSPLFDKSSFLYGLHKAKPHIRKHNVALLTEGPIDAIMVHQAGYPMAVATSGTAVTTTHLQTLQRLSNRLLLVLDSDAAGQRAALRVIEMSYTLGIDTKVVMLPDGSDPADVIAEDVERFKTCVREAVSATAFLTRYVAQHYGDGGDDRVRGVKEAVLPVIAASKDPMARAHAVKEVAAFCGLDAAAVAESLAQAQGGVVVQDADPALRRKKAAVRIRDSQTVQQEKIGKLLSTVAMAIQFLKKHNESLTTATDALLDAVQKIESLPEADEKVTQMRYEVEFADKDTQIQGARDELEVAAKYFLAESKKGQEMERLQATL